MRRLLPALAFLTWVSPAHAAPAVACPASHGCVRTPMWIAPSLFASNGYGETIYVYY